jgi:hypothetical protein
MSAFSVCYKWAEDILTLKRLQEKVLKRQLETKDRKLLMLFFFFFVKLQ